MSQRDIATHGVSFTYVSRIESGQRQPSVKALRLLASKLGVSAEYLETGRELPPASDWELRLGQAELELRLGSARTAGKALAELLEEARASNATFAELRAQVGLASAAARLGRYDEAIAALEGLLASGRLSVAEHADAYAVLASSYAAIGEPQRGVVLLRRCLDELAAAPVRDTALLVRFAGCLSQVLVEAGDPAGARDAVASALERASGIADRSALVRLYWSLAGDHSAGGRQTQALEYVRRAIALLEVGEDALQLARAHELRAKGLLDEGSGDAARRHLELAERLLDQLGDPASLGSVQAEWARFALEAGDRDEARRYAVAALEILESAERFECGRSWRSLADVFERLGEPDLAERSYRTAVESLTQHGGTRQLAEAYRSLGKFLRSVGRKQEALDALERAADLATNSVGPSAVHPSEPFAVFD